MRMRSHVGCGKLHRADAFGGAAMTNREATKALIEGAYAARDRGDIVGLMAAFHQDAAFGLVGDKTALHVAGIVRGHSNVRASLGGFIEAFKFDNREIISFVIDGERA